jgi:hypothetical protein
MAIDLTGISNENEFYTQHYLTAILEADLKQLFEGWATREAESGERPPHERLRGLARSYTQFRGVLAKATDVDERIDLQREWFASFFGDLGYTITPKVKELTEGAQVPLRAEITRNNGQPDLWILETISADADLVDPLALPFLPEQYPRMPRMFRVRCCPGSNFSMT